jgi:phage shock protein C
MIAGVAAGVADYIDVDPSIVRTAWVTLAIMTGGILVVPYGVMWLVVSDEPDAEDESPGPEPGP